jgi:hypothetical protein
MQWACSRQVSIFSSESGAELDDTLLAAMIKNCCDSDLGFEPRYQVDDIVIRELLTVRWRGGGCTCA